jgi:hypothetical protein
MAPDMAVLADGPPVAFADVSEDALPPLQLLGLSVYQTWMERDMQAHPVIPLCSLLFGLHTNAFLLGLVLGCFFAGRFTRDNPPTADDPVKGVSV